MLCYEYPPLGGGTGVACQNLVQEFKKQDSIKLDVLTSSVNKKRVEKLSKNISIVLLDVGKNNKNLDHQRLINLLV